MRASLLLTVLPVENLHTHHNIIIKTLRTHVYYLQDAGLLL